jgi:hypothetical protein
MKLILPRNVRNQNKETRKIAVLVLATMIAGIGIVTAHDISNLCVIDKGIKMAVNLSQKDDLIYTNSTIVVKGHLSPDLKTNEHLWIAVKPDNSISNWWPQSNGELKPNEEGEFEGNAFLGGDKDEVFTVGILILNDTLNRTFSKWVVNSKIKNYWPPITEGDPITKTKISKNIIEDTALAYIRIKLIEEKAMLNEDWRASPIQA